MPALIDLLDQYLFFDAPGLVARAAIQRAWEYTTANSWDKLYLASLEDAISEELPHLSAYSGPDTKRPTRPELARVLAADLGEPGANLATLDQSSRAFVTEIARTMQGQRLITINGHNLFTDEYRQILLNLFDHAHTRFKSVLLRSEPAYSAALGTATSHDPILAASIAAYLERQFGVKLVSLDTGVSVSTPLIAPEPVPEQAQAVDSAVPELQATPAPEISLEDSSLEPLSEPIEQATPEDTTTSLASQAPEAYPVAWEHTNEFTPPISNAVSEPDLSLASEPVAEMPRETDTGIPPLGVIAAEEPGSLVTPPEPELDETVATSEPPIVSSEQAVTAGEEYPTEATARVGETSFAALSIHATAPEPESPPEPLLAAGVTEQRTMPNRLRILVATPADVHLERRLLTELVRELDARARARFGLELELVTPQAADVTDGRSLLDSADMFVGVIWLQFGAESILTTDETGMYFAGTRADFARALELGSGRGQGWLRTVIYRSIRPPMDMLHLDVSEYARVQQFFERAGAFTGDDLVRVFADPSELIHDARARLDAWIYNYAGDLASSLTEYGNNSAANGQIDQALVDYKKAVELYRELDRPEQELALWLQVGALQTSTDNAAAADAFNIALRLARRIEDDRAAAHCLRSLGALDAAQGAWTGALDKYQQAHVYLEPNDPEYRALLMDQVDANESLGDVAHARGDDATAMQALGNAMSLARQLGDIDRQAALWTKLGGLAAERGDWNQAIAAYDNALGLGDLDQPSVRRTELLNAQANAYTQLALAARSSGDLDAAENAYQAALRANAQGSGNRRQRVALFTALAVLASDRADWERGIESNEQALALLDSPDDIETRRGLMASQALAFQQLAARRAEQGDLTAASSAYRDALALFQELDAGPEQGDTLYRLGELAMRQDEWSEANAYLSEALPRLKTGSNQDLYTQSLKSQAAALQHIGDDRRAAGDWAGSEVAYVQAYTNMGQVGLGQETGPLLYRLGLVTAAQSRLPEALAYFQQARTRLDSDADAETRNESLRAQSGTLRQYAGMYRSAGEFQSAEAYYRQQLEIAQELQDDAIEGEAFYSLGLVAADKAEWDNAIDLYDQALARLQSPGAAAARDFIARDQLTAYQKIGERERNAGQLAQSELAYRSALTLAQSLGDKEPEADILYVLGSIAIEQRNWDEALVDLRRALGIYNLMPSAPNKPQVIFSIGRAQRGQKQSHLRETLDQAALTQDTALFLTAVELARELGDSHSAAIASRQLGDIAAQQSDWDQALVRYDEALAGLTGPDNAAERHGIQRAQLETRAARAERARQNSDWGSADADLFVALDLARELDDRNARGALVSQRGHVAADQGHWTQAIDLYSEALNLLPKDSTDRSSIERAQSQAFESLGNADREGQNWAAAESDYSQALALRQSLGDAAPQVTLLTCLAGVAMSQGRWDQAIPHLNSAHALAAELDLPDRVTEIHAQLDLATRALKRQEQETIEQRGDAFRASRAYDLAGSEYAAALTLAEELEDRASQAELHAKLGFIATETGALEQALEHYRRAAGMYDFPENADQRQALMELQAQALQDLGNNAGSNGAWSEAYAYYSQAVALLDAPAQENHRLEVVQLQAVTCENLGDQSQGSGDWDNALNQFRRAAGLYALVGATHALHTVTERQSDVLTEQARRAQQAGDATAAQALYGEAVAGFSQVRAVDKLRQVRREQMTSFRAAGILAAESGDLAAARQQLRQALAIADELPDQPTQADLYHRLGQLAARQADWPAALLSYQYALERVGDQSQLEAALLADELTAHQEAGTAFRIAGDLDGTEASYVRALTNAQALNDAAHISELTFLLGTLAADREQWEAALGYYDQALTYLTSDDSQRSEIQPYRAFALQQLGDTRRSNGQFQAAAEAYAGASAIADETGDTVRQGQVLYRIGLLHAAQGLWQPALDAYAQAQARIGDTDPESSALLRRDASFATQALKREHLTAHLDKATTARTAGAWTDAVAEYSDALNLATELNEGELGDSIRRDLVSLYAAQGDALLTTKDWDGSLQAYRQSLQLAQDYALLEQVAQRHDDLLALVAASAQDAKTLEDQQDPDAAQAAYDRTLEFANQIGDTNMQAVALTGLGRLAQSRAAWQESESLYTRARPLFVESENAAGLIELDANLDYVRDILARQAQQADAAAQAELAVNAGRYDEARAQYRTAFGLAHGLDDSPAAKAFAAALVAVAAAQARSIAEQGDTDQSERAYREALGVAREFDDADAVHSRENEIVALKTAHASALRADKQWASAELALRDALAAAEEFNNAEAAESLRMDLIALATERALDARSNQKWDEAEELYRHAIGVAYAFGHSDAVRNLETELVGMTSERATAGRSEGTWQDKENLYRHAIQVALEFERPTSAQTIETDLIALATERARELQAAHEWEASESAYRHAFALANEFGNSTAVTSLESGLIVLATEYARELGTARDWEASETAYRHAFALADEFGDSANLEALQGSLVALASERARVLQSSQDWDLTENAYRHALVLAKEFHDEDTERSLESKLIALATERAQETHAAQEWQDTESAYRRALALADEFHDLGAAKALQTNLIGLATERAQETHTAQEWQETESAYRRALALADEFNDLNAAKALRTSLIGLDTERAQELHEAREWETSASAYRHALALASEFGDSDAIHAIQQRLIALAADHAAALKTGVNLHTDEQAFRGALAVAQEFGDTRATRDRQQDLIRLVLAQAAIARSNQDWSATRALAQHQLDLAQEFGDLESQADALYALGEIAQTTGDLPTAQNYFLTAAQTYEQAEANHGTAAAQHQLNKVETILRHQTEQQMALANGANARAEGRSSEAEQEYRTALTESEFLQDAPMQAACLVALAELAFDRQDWQASLDHYDAAGLLYDRLEQPDRVAELSQEHARVTRRLEMSQRDDARVRGDRAIQSANLVVAAQAYRDGLALAQKLDDPSSAGSFEMSLGQIAVAEHRLEDAAGWYDTAAASFGLARDESQAATARTQLLATYTALGDEHAAREEWDLAHTTYTNAVLIAARDTPGPQRAYLLSRLGLVAVQQNDLQHAIDYFDRALGNLDADDLADQRGSIIQERANAWQQMGDAAMDASELQESESAYNHALADSRTLNDNGRVAEVLHSLGLARGAQGNWQGALEAHQESYSLVRDMDVPEVALVILAALAEDRVQVGEIEAARQDYQKALDIANSMSDAPHTAEIELALGGIACSQERWQDAIQHYDAARAIYTDLGDPERVAVLNSQQANAFERFSDGLYNQGQWSGAENALSRAIELDAATGRTDRDGYLYYRRGNAAAAQTRFGDAIADYDRASVALPDDEKSLRDRTLGQLAFALQQQGKRASEAGNLDQAEMAFTRAAKIAQASDNFDQVSDLWFRLGILYRSRAQHDEALSAFRRAYDFDRLDGSTLQQAEISEAIAERLLQRGQSALEKESFDTADIELAEALEFALQANNPQMLGSALEALGNSASGRNDTVAAIDYYARAGKTFASIEDTDRWRVVSRQQASLLVQSAGHRLETNEFADAENLYRRALVLQQAAGDTTLSAETHLGLGRTLLAQEQFADALVEFQQADDAFDPDDPDRTQLLASYADALEAHADQALSLGELDRAQDEYTRAAAYRDTLGESARAGLDWQQLADIAILKRELTTAVSANEQALARLNSPETQQARRVVLQQQAKILSGIGDEQRQLARWSDASETYRRALEISQEQGDLESIAHLHTLLGSLAAEQEHWDESDQEYTHALDVYDELNQPEAQAATWAHLADMYRVSAQYDRATRAYERARDLYEKTGKRLNAGTMWLNLGHVEGDRNEWDTALDQYQTALHVFNDIGAKSNKPEVYRAMERAVRNAKRLSADQAAAQGDFMLEEGEFVDAEQAYRSALELYQEADERMLQARMQNQLGLALEGQQRSEEALSHYRVALKGFEHLGIAQAQVGVIANMGDAHRRTQNWNPAEASYRQALALNEPLGDAARAGELYSSLGGVREAQGDWESALEHYRQAVTQYELADMEQARLRVELDLVRAQLGAREQAEQDYVRRLEQARAEDNLAEAGEILNTLGLFAAEDGRWSVALEYYREAVANFEHLETDSESREVWRAAQGTVLNNIGDASQQIGAWNDADYAYSRALGVAREIGDRESEAILLSNLGIAAQAQEQLPRALDYNLQALDSYSEIGQDAPRAELLERVGDLQLKLEQTAAAETSYRGALALAEQSNENERIGRLLKQIGLLAEARGAEDEALDFYERALARATEVGNEQEQQDLWMRMGALYAATGRVEQAEQAHQAALALAIAHGDEPAQAKLHLWLGRSATHRNDWQTALDEYQASLAFSEKFDSPGEQLEALEHIGDAYAALEEPVQADEAYHAAIELAPRVPTANLHKLWLSRAALAEKQNRWQDAAENLEQALAHPDPVASPQETINLMFRHGDAAMLAHMWSAADSGINDGMELANAANDRVLYGWGMNRLGLLSQAQRNWGQSLEDFQEAIEIFRVNEQPLGEAHVLNNIARLKLETNDPNEADLFAQAALSISQAFGSNMEASRSLYTRGLASIEAQDFEPAQRFLNQAVAADPGNWAAQLQLGSALLASGSIAEASQQAEAGLGQFPDWELGAQTQLTIASLYRDETGPFKANLKRTRSMLRTATERRTVSQEMLDAVESIVRALEGHAEAALTEWNASADKPALPVALEARRFVKTTLLALSKSPRRFRGKQVLVSQFAAPKPGAQKRTKRGSGARPRSSGESSDSPGPNNEPSDKENDSPDKGTA